MVMLLPQVGSGRRDDPEVVEGDVGILPFTDERKIAAIYAAIQESDRKMDHSRAVRLEFVKQFMGHYHLPDDKGDRGFKNPVNLIRMTASIYTRHLAANNPRAQIIAREERLWPDAVDLEAAINRMIEEMDLREVLATCTLDAMFCCGIAVVGTEDSNKEVLVDGKWQTVSSEFVDWIDLDDWIQDMSVKRWDDRQYCGHRFRRPLKAAREDESYHQKARRSLRAVERKQVSETGQPKMGSAGGGSESPEEDIYAEVELLHLHFPKENKILIIPSQRTGGGDDLLAVYDWEGPPGGPYHRLDMMKVPGNMMPISPISGVADLHYLQNNLWRKMGDQAQRAKRIGVVAGRDAKDGKRIFEDIPDGGVGVAQRPEAAVQLDLGGVQAPTLAFSLQIQNLYSWMAGNINSLGGLSPQSETLGQDKLLAASASKQVAEMADRVTRFTRGILQDIVWWEMRDSFREIETTKRIPGTDIDMPVTVRPSEMLPDAARFNLEVHPYSMRDRSPEERLQALLQYFNFVVMPNIQFMQQEGITIEFEKIMHLIARQADLPEFEHILHFTGQRPEAQSTRRNDTGASPPIKRTENIRTNRSGTTQDAQNNAAMQALLGGTQASQAAAGTGMVG